MVSSAICPDISHQEMLAVQDRSPAGSTDSACILLRSRLDLANAFGEPTTGPCIRACPNRSPADLLLFEDLFQTAMALPVAADVVMSPSSEDVDVEMDAAAP